MPEDLPTTYALVDRAALRHNMQQLLGLLGGRARLCAVVKANAYGHGLVETSRLFAELGCEALGVATADEGIALRQAGLETRILVFHPPAAGELRAAVQHHLTMTLTQPEHVSALAAAQQDLDAQSDWQLGVDVGLGRSGLTDDPVAFLDGAERELGLRPWGVWTHLGPGMAPEALPPHVPASWEEARTVAARLRYLAAMRDAMSAEAEHPVFHAAASAAVCDSDALWWDMVRVGTLLYGVHPPHARRAPLDLRLALSLRTRIVELRTVAAGMPVGYGGEFRTRRRTRLATVPVGLHHGVGMIPYSTMSIAGAAKRSLREWWGHRGKAFEPPQGRVRGEPAAMVGRVSLNECTVDVTDVSEVELGDEIIIPSRMTTLSPAIPRVYVDTE